MPGQGEVGWDFVLWVLETMRRQQRWGGRWVEDAMGGKARETARLKVQEGVHEAPGWCPATAVTSTAAFRGEIVEWGLMQSGALS